MAAENPGDAVRVSLVPAGGHFSGIVKFWGVARVEGRLEGPVEAEGRLIVGVEGTVAGSVEVDELDLAGEIDGDVVARRRAHLLEGATLRGTLDCPSVQVTDGALIEGRCRIGGS